MAIVLIPPLLRDLTRGEEQVEVPGKTVGEVVGNLEVRYPGIRTRLCEGEQISPHVAVMVDGEQSQMSMLQPVDSSSEVQFLPAFEGG